MAKKRKVEETEEIVLGEVTTIQGIEDGGIPAEVVPIVVDDRIYAATPSIPNLTAALQEKNHQMVNTTRDVFNQKSNESMFAADRSFISALIAETCCSEHRRLDETLMRAIAKSQLYDDTFKKMENVNSNELYNDIVNILDLSCDYAESNIERITSKEFHDKLSDIVHKYNPELVDKLNQVQVLDRKATPLLEDNKDNN